jgi:acetyltransferase-like isoleucine patch superfamily enzyme
MVGRARVDGSVADTFIHPHALVETDRVGAGTRIWAFAHVMRDATIGRGCNIGDHAFIESQVTIGDNVTVKNGVAIWQHVHVGDNVFLGPNVTLTNDRHPRSTADRTAVEPSVKYSPAETWIEEGVTVGANATILCGIRLGRRAFIGAGAVVTHDVPPHALVVGNPAQQTDWVCHCGRPLGVSGELAAGRGAEGDDEARCAACGRRYHVADSGLTEWA